MTTGNMAAVVVAHPGHEVRIHGWLEQERPQVFVLTDGSGRAGQPRIASTAQYLKRFDMRPGCIFGRLTDMEVYRAVLARDFAPFVNLSEELAGALVRAGARLVAGDACEGYNTTHDIARLITNAAVEMTGRSASGGAIANYDFTVVNRPDHCPARLRASAVWLHLDNEAFARKLAAAFEFYPELAAETRDALAGRGDEATVEHFKLNGDEHAATDLSGMDMFRVECLRPISHGDAPFESAAPFYEQYGEGRVAEGLYERVIRYREHIRPLADALAENVERRS
ncbi:MAG: hypothetical protein QOE46_2354 [Acidobacteriota bacterium]|jgi:hypothetical protein|nr:hypothetical protein [Acidobacteriota bacterium]